MSKPNRAQLRFARQMTARQWHALSGLYQGLFFLSATERGDPEIRELMTLRLARAHYATPEGGLPVWSATAAGRAIVRLHHRGKL